MLHRGGEGLEWRRVGVATELSSAFLMVDLHFSFLPVVFATEILSSNPRSTNTIIRKLLEVIQHEFST